MTLEKRTELIADIKEYFNARPITIKSDESQVLCHSKEDNRWILVDLLTTESTIVTDKEATAINKKWLKHILL